MKDLYHQDVWEMIERESRKFGIWEISDEHDPLFAPAYRALWDAFGPAGEMEREEAIRGHLREDPFEPLPSGTFLRYFLVAARDEHGNLLGVRDGSVFVNQSYAPDLCVVYLSHIYMFPEARGTVLSYWMRICPVDIAIQFMAELHYRGLIRLPQPDQPGRNFGMRVDLAAEMEYFSPEDRISWQRILFYGRGGFDAINPRHFPYVQPDFRDPEEIRRTGHQPLPFMILVRRMGREREAMMPIDEASALMRMIYDDFQDHCESDLLQSSLQVVLNRLLERERTKNFVQLLPLPTGPKDLSRLRRLFRYKVYERYYGRSIPEVAEVLSGPIKEELAKDPHWLDKQIAAIGRQLEQRPHWVFPNRDRDWTFDDQYVQLPPESGEPEVTMEEPAPDVPDLMPRIR
ncbi:MAG: hypothetical protein H6735_27670 [Alphaproteobacteria bacterium]|nr:hypothetical protein [Alphaproteobacteria bacterium]